MDEDKRNDAEVKTEPDVKPKPRTRARRRRDQLSDLALPMNRISERTPLETFSRKKALVQLRDALASQQPVVKRCVAQRLSKHLSYAELAKICYLTVEEVTQILGKMRVWVRRYTLYFENDWYWKEDGQPRKLMQG